MLNGKNQDLKLHIQHDSIFVNFYLRKKRLEGNPLKYNSYWDCGQVLFLLLKAAYIFHVF